MNEKILTLHPEGKAGVNISKARYDQIRAAILSVFDESDLVAFSRLPEAVGKRLPDFEGSIGWYVTVVKLDLESRGIIERVRGQRPQQLRLAEK